MWWRYGWKCWRMVGFPYHTDWRCDPLSHGNEGILNHCIESRERNSRWWPYPGGISVHVCQRWHAGQTVIHPSEIAASRFTRNVAGGMLLLSSRKCWNPMHPPFCQVNPPLSLSSQPIHQGIVFPSWFWTGSPRRIKLQRPWILPSQPLSTFLVPVRSSSAVCGFWVQ